MEERGRINRYTCNACSWYANTINMTVGVTPYTIACDNQEGSAIDHMCSSSMYSISLGGPNRDWLAVSHVFYRPDRKQLDAMATAHVEKLFGLPGPPKEEQRDSLIRSFKQYTWDGCLSIAAIGSVSISPDDLPDDCESSTWIQFVADHYGDEAHEYIERRLSRSLG